MRKSLLKSTLSLVIVMLFVGIAIWYVVTNYDEFAKLSVKEPIFIFPAILLMLLNIYASGAVVDLAMEPHGAKISRKEAFGLAAITRFSNQISPSYVGATVRAAYMKRNYGVSIAKFSSSFIISNLLQFMITGLLTIVTFLMLEPASGGDRILYIVGGFIVILAGVLYMPVGLALKILSGFNSRHAVLNKLHGRVVELLGSYATVRNHPGLLPRTIAWMLITTFTFASVYWLMYATLGFHVGVVSAFFIAALSGWSIVFAITPGSIGVREGLMALGATIAGVSISATLLVAILLRLMVFIVSGLLSLYFTPRMITANKIQEET